MSGKVWLITGASSGLGRAMAEVVLERASEAVVVTARDSASVAEFNRRHPSAAMTAELDVRDPERIHHVVDLAVRRFGRIDVLVNNAGYGLFGAVEEIDDGELRAQFETNLFGAWAMTRAVLAHMRRRRRGHIVSISSSAGIAGIPGAGAYCASKFALEGMMDSLAGEVLPLGIATTTVDPGLLRTDFAGRSRREAARAFTDYHSTAGAARRTVRDTDGAQPGDPRRVALAIVDAVGADPSPRRLVIGTDARAQIERKLDQVRSDLATWTREDVTFADLPPEGAPR